MKNGHSVQSVQMPKPDGIRDTIEAIVVAFILAFVFRAFVVEAFVIPTGSMAPSLYGLHGEHRCEACGYHFAYGIREAQVVPDDSIVQRGTLSNSFDLHCPNCGWSGHGNAALNSRTDRVVPSSGDRILVLKWPYDIGGDLLGPKRWDVVVFKNPQDGEMNFIKRLLGLPGEVLEIINGDVYTAPIDAVDPDIIEALKQPPKTRAEGGQPFDRRLNDEQAGRLANVLKIQRKTRVAQESLWMIHYDHDYKPDLARYPPNPPHFDPPRWVPDGEPGNTASAWDVSTPCVRFEPLDNQVHQLRLKGKPIQDTYGYNNVVLHDSVLARGRLRSSACNVGDVGIRFVLTPQAPRAGAPGARGSRLDPRPSTLDPHPSGYISLSLRKGPDEFRATIAADGEVRLDRSGKNGIPIPLGTARAAPLKAGKPLTVEFENLDYRVALRLDGVQVLATDDTQYAPDLSVLLQGDRHGHGHGTGLAHRQNGRLSEAAVGIEAQGLPLEIRHLVVQRDVFYRSPAIPEEQGNPFTGYPGWGTESNPIVLRGDPPDYFCCGDNSPQSKDSRLWWEVCPMLQQRGQPKEPSGGQPQEPSALAGGEPQEPSALAGGQTGHAAYSRAYQFGTVPGDQMIGRAFFVYWPNGMRFSKDTPAVIPNMGRMRIIR
ncbi:MAG: hypothetical protein JXQ75_00285 [Phycisphaerae bacterium]|nr:hypothetical protein [Phycisphaerae bacterium]